MDEFEDARRHIVKVLFDAVVIQRRYSTDKGWLESVPIPAELGTETDVDSVADDDDFSEPHLVIPSLEFANFSKQVEIACGSFRKIEQRLIDVKDGSEIINFGGCSGITAHGVAVQFGIRVEGAVYNSLVFNLEDWPKRQGFASWLTSGDEPLTQFTTNWSKVRDSLAEISAGHEWDLKDLIRLESYRAKRSGTGGAQDEWMSLADVAKGFGWFVGRENKPDSKRVGQKVAAGELRDNGMSRGDRRILKASIIDYCTAKGVAWNEDP